MGGSSRGMIHSSERKLWAHAGGNFGGRQKLENGILIVSQIKLDLGRPTGKMYERVKENIKAYFQGLEGISS